MSRRELELQAKALGIRGYSSMRVPDLQERITMMTIPSDLEPSAEDRAEAIERHMPLSSQLTHECRHCGETFDDREMFMSERVMADHGIEAWFCRNTKACSARVEE